MVRGFTFQDPQWGLRLQGSTIDPSWAKAPQVSFAEPVAGLAEGFMKGINQGDAMISRRSVGGQIQDMAKNPSKAEQLMGAGASYVQGGPGTDTIAAPYSRSVPTFAQGGAGATAKTMPSGTHWNAENRQAIIEEAQAAGYNPEDLATVMSYETAGSMDPWKRGPTTKWGQHRGLIQWGEPQARQYGVNPDMPFRDQVRASIKYLQDKGLKPGMGMLEMYSAINAGGISPSHFNRSDTAAGGAPGTVRDKVQSQMGAHRKRVQAWFGQDAGMPSPGAVAAPAPAPQVVAQQQQAAQPPVSAPAQAGQAPQAPGAPQTVQQQAQQVLAAPDQFDPRTVQWAAGVVGQQQGNQPAAVPQLSPSPNDREAAAAVTRNQVETQQQAQAPKPPTFMGIPSQAPGANVNPQAAVQGGGGQDILMGGSGGGSPGAPPQQPVATAAAAPPPQAAVAPQPVQRQAPAYRPPIRDAGGATDPRLLRAYGTAIAGGDPNTISAMQTMLQQSAKAGNGKVSLHNLPDGTTVLLDEATGEVSPYAQSGVTKAPETKEINGVTSQWNGQQWVPLSGGTAKAPETKDINGVTSQWDGQKWVPLGAGAGGMQHETIPPDAVERRRQLGIPDNDKRIYQRDPKDGVLKPIQEGRANEDKSLQVEQSVWQDFESQEPVKRYRGMEQAMQGLGGAFSQGNGPGDLFSVVQMFKAIDPTSTVSAGETANAEQAASLPSQLVGIYNKAVGAGGKFTPELRAEFYNTLRALYINQRAQVGRIKDTLGKRAGRYGLKIDDIVDFAPADFPKAEPTTFPDKIQGDQPQPPAAAPPLHLTVPGTRPQDRGASDAFDLNTNPPVIGGVRKLSD